MEQKSDKTPSSQHVVVNPAAAPVKRKRKWVLLVVVVIAISTVVVLLGYLSYRLRNQKPSTSQDVPAQKNLDLSKQKYQDVSIDKQPEEIEKQEDPSPGSATIELRKR